MNSSVPYWERFCDTGEVFARIDGKIIARKSIYTATVYDESLEKLVNYKSHIQHCVSCMGEVEDGCLTLDECCCTHARFHSKKEEMSTLRRLGSGKLKERSNEKINGFAVIIAE